MLIQLNISNYAIIEHVSVEFDAHLNIITGETGAGKSIFIDALSLILGQRLDWTIFQHQDKKCIIEATFRIPHEHPVIPTLKAKDVYINEELLIVRKEINPVSKTSRNFINDNLVSAADLGEIGNMLIDLHQQFDAFDIYDQDFQLRIIDIQAAQTHTVATYQTLYNEYLKEKKILEHIQTERTQSLKDLEYYTFLEKELADFNVKHNELEHIAERLKLLEQTEHIQSAVDASKNILYEGEQSVYAMVTQVLSLLKPIKSTHESLHHITTLLNEYQTQIQEICREMSSVLERLDNDPQAINELTERLNTGYRLLKKHQVKESQELIAIHHDLSSRLSGIQNSDERYKQQSLKVDALYHKALALADDIHTQRMQHIPFLIDKIHHLLASVGMPNAKMNIDLQAQTDLNAWGRDTIELLLDSNKTNHFKPLKKVASGGELNRLMLAIKSIMAQSTHLPTLIFDEIDTGVSGEVARQIGNVLKQLAQHLQIICITHQPTIAAKGQRHIFVSKKDIDNKIQTQMHVLSDAERVQEIAEMLAGKNATPQTFDMAKEMLGTL